MNAIILVFGVLLVATGFVTLVRKVHDRSLQESLALVRHARGGAAPAVAAFAGLLAPVVSSIAAGIVMLVIGVLSTSVSL
jgi:hypothetical protein